ncbi:MAG: terminase [Planctomycetaceae bacterium]|nr:terminase [Planctomycetaceae bacterium]MCB9950934.1 terminase [Planctomycetaceae bacterium]
MSSSFRRDQRIQQVREIRQRRRRHALLHPEYFRRYVAIPTPDGTQSLRDVLQPWQLVDFSTLDPGWAQLAGRATEVDSRAHIQRAYIERPRGHSKTSDMAVQLVWILLAARNPVRGLAAAADRDQASLIHEAVQRLVRANPTLCGDIELVQHWIRNRQTQSKLEIISSDVAGSWGALPDFVICDELCHWEKPDLWYSLLSSAAKKPSCMLTVLTNAGVGRGWQWQVREHAKTSSDWHFSSLEGPQAPWITETWLDEQRALLPEPVYSRLWLNQWQHSDGEFVTLEEAGKCCDNQLSYQPQSRSYGMHVAAIDYAEKHDYTVGCVAHWEGNRIVVDRMDVVVPTPHQPTPVKWVEDWMEEISSNFPNVTFVVDEYQLLGVIQKYEHRANVKRFQFLSGEGNHRLALRLRQLILQQEVCWYPGCGAIPSPTGQRDDLETELASLILRQSTSGRVRIDHRHEAGCHDDRAFALGAACLELSTRSQEVDFLRVTPPSLPGAFDW